MNIKITLFPAIVTPMLLVPISLMGKSPVEISTGVTARSFNCRPAAVRVASQDGPRSLNATPDLDPPESNRDGQANR